MQTVPVTFSPKFEQSMSSKGWSDKPICAFACGNSKCVKAILKKRCPAGNLSLTNGSVHCYTDKYMNGNILKKLPKDGGRRLMITFHT